MEINGKNPLANLDPNIQRLEYQQSQQRPQGAGEESRASEMDRIEFSVRSREVQNLDAMIKAAADIRTERVEQIRNAVQNGTYNVKAEMIADKILSGRLVDEIL